MIRKCLITKAILLGVLVATCMLARPAATQAQAAQDQAAKPTYTIPEYNAFQAANAEKDPQARVKLLDDFVAKFPNSTLNAVRLPALHQDLLGFEELSQGHRVRRQSSWRWATRPTCRSRLQALRHAARFSRYAYNPKAPDAPDQLTKERDAALARREAAGCSSEAGSAK